MKIKTRESLKTIKTFDRAENLAGKTKSSFSDLNRGAEETQGMGYSSGTEYAGTRLQESEETGTRNALYGANRAGRWGVRETRRNIQRWRFRQKKPILSKQKALPAPKRQMLSAPKTADKTAKGAKTAQKTAKATLKASQKAAQVAKVAAKATVHGIKVAGKATVAAVKATVAAVKGIVAAIAAGGWIAIVVIVAICAIALVVGSVFSFFTPGKDETSLNSVIFEVENHLAEAIEQCKYIYSCEAVEIRGSPSPWKEVLAVYMVKYKVDGDDMDGITSFDEKQAERLKQIYNDFNNPSADVEERTRTVTVWEETESGEWEATTREESYNCLIVTHSPLTPADMAERYNFNQKKRQLLNDLLSPDFDALWDMVFKKND